MQIHGRGRACVWAGGVLWIGEALSPGQLHAHHAIQLSFGLDGPLQFRAGEDAPWSDYDACLIPADVPHAFNGAGRRFAIIFVDPETAEGHRLAARAGHAIGRLPDDEAAAGADILLRVWEGSRACLQLEPAAREVIGLLAGTGESRRTVDPRILGAIELIRARLDSRVTLTGIARDLNISPSRLRHLFVDEVGLPFRTYVLWERLRRVIQGLGRETLTHAALAAGFADAAHMTRTFRRMIGVPPSALELD